MKQYKNIQFRTCFNAELINETDVKIKVKLKGQTSKQMMKNRSKMKLRNLKL